MQPPEQGGNKPKINEMHASEPHAFIGILKLALQCRGYAALNIGTAHTASLNIGTEHIACSAFLLSFRHRILSNSIRIVEYVSVETIDL